MEDFVLMLHFIADGVIKNQIVDDAIAILINL
jgi:hypothetical protein